MIPDRYTNPNEISSPYISILSLVPLLGLFQLVYFTHLLTFSFYIDVYVSDFHRSQPSAQQHTSILIQYTLSHSLIFYFFFFIFILNLADSRFFASFPIILSILPHFPASSAATIPPWATNPQQSLLHNFPANLLYEHGPTFSRR